MSFLRKKNSIRLLIFNVLRGQKTTVFASHFLPDDKLYCSKKQQQQNKTVKFLICNRIKLSNLTWNENFCTYIHTNLLILLLLLLLSVRISFSMDVL